MKKIKLMSTALIAAVAMFVLAGCSQPLIDPDLFRTAAEERGLILTEESDYDGYGAYLIEAWMFETDADPEVDEPLYVISLTVDANVDYARDEFEYYVTDVSSIGGSSKSGSGGNYQYQINRSSIMYGVAYRIDKINVLVIAGIEHKAEIVALLADIGLSVDI